MRLVALVFCLFFGSLSSQAQEAKVEELDARVRNLEVGRQNLENAFDLKAQELKLEAATTLKEETDKLQDEILDIKSQVKFYGILLSGLTLVGLIGLLFGARKYINTQMQLRIDGLIKEKEEDIRNMIYGHELEARIRKKTRLLVLSPTGKLQEDIIAIISKFNFPTENVAYQVLKSKEDIIKADLDGKQLLVINDIGGEFNRDVLSELLEQSSKEALFLGFATGQKQLPRHHKMNFANSKFTFYQNLINLAKYSEIVG